MSEVYDNWEKLVEAIFKNKERQQLALRSSFSSFALCSSFSSCTSDDLSSSASLIDVPLNYGPNNPLEPLPGVRNRGFAARTARLIAAPAILRTLFLRTKPELLHHVLDNLRRFSFRELLNATDNFNNKNLLGSGGFADVYEGGRLKDGSLVAVKRCMSMPNQRVDRQFPTEVEIMSKVMHRNLLHLHWCCVTRKERVLVYALMANGSVASCLRERSTGQHTLIGQPENG